MFRPAVEEKAVTDDSLRIFLGALGMGLAAALRDSIREWKDRRKTKRSGVALDSVSRSGSLSGPAR